MKKITISLWIVFLTGLFNQTVSAASLLCESKLSLVAIPKNAYYLPENQALQMQKAINRYKVVRLKPGGNYSKALGIKLGSNQSLYGLNGTKLPAVTIAKGSVNVVLSGVSPTRISFEAGGITRDNCINRISNSGIVVKDATLENNLFTDLSNVSISVDTSRQGYLKNNRFIRTMVHAGYPAITMIGDSARQSTGNQFIWTNILTPHGDGIIIKNQQYISFIGLDAESWNWSQKATYPGMMNVFNTDFVSVFMANGGDNHNRTGQYFNLDAKTALIQGMRIGRTQNSGVILGDNVENLVTVDSLDIGLEKSNAKSRVIEMFKDYQPVLIENRNTIKQASLSEASKLAIASVFQADQDAYSRWELPGFAGIANPAGNNWQTVRKDQTDASDYIQGLIDQNGIAELPAGIYYIAKPLILKQGQGIIGAGADKTALVATSPDVDLIIGGDHAGETKVTSFTLADITLQGGYNGIKHSDQGSGQGADYNQIVLSHVTFRDMKNAGILIDNIYAWDNNFIDHVQFYRCNTGIKQRPDPAYVGGDRVGITFLDKNVFYQTQFIENGVAIDWQAKRGNNLNAFINCLFKDNRQAIDKSNSDSTFFANSLFETASDQPILKTNRVTGFVHTHFISKQSAHELFDGNVFCNHCSFDNGTVNAGVIVSPNSKTSYFINNTLSKPVNQPINTGVIANSNFSANPGAPTTNSLFNNQTAQPF